MSPLKSVSSVAPAAMVNVLLVPPSICSVPASISTMALVLLKPGATRPATRLRCALLEGAVLLKISGPSRGWFAAPRRRRCWR